MLFRQFFDSPEVWLALGDAKQLSVQRHRMSQKARQLYSVIRDGDSRSGLVMNYFGFLGSLCVYVVLGASCRKRSASHARPLTGRCRRARDRGARDADCNAGRRQLYGASLGLV